MINTFEKVIEIYKGLVGTEDFEEALWKLDADIDKFGMWNIAKGCNALDENKSCEDFSIAHMTAFNNTFGNKY